MRTAYAQKHIVVPEPVHRALRVAAAEQGKPMWHLLCDLLGVDYTQMCMQAPPQHRTAKQQ